MVRMIRKIVPFGLMILALSSMLIAACDKNKGKTPATDDFDKKALLSNISNNLILPYYFDYAQKTATLKSMVADFTTDPNTAKLDSLRIELKQTVIAWQYVAAFEFGPAQEISLYSNTNTFPTDTANVRNNIASGNYNLATAANIASKGFPAIDFLVYGASKTDNEIVALYKTSSLSTNYQNYLLDIATEIDNNAKSVYNKWNTSYKNEFINNTGNSVGSSVGMLVNQLNYDWEFLKNFQIGIPLGKRTLGNPLPEKVEAYFGGYSSELAKEHQTAISNLYFGIGKDGINREGFDDYLVFLKTNYNGQPLADAIKGQFEKVKTTLALVPEPLSKAVVDQQSLVNTTYSEMQKQLVLLKTDLPSALGVLITYQDNDGD
jgi:predicted lipoprotein